MKSYDHIQLQFSSKGLSMCLEWTTHEHIDTSVELKCRGEYCYLDKIIISTVNNWSGKRIIWQVNHTHWKFPACSAIMQPTKPIKTCVINFIYEAIHSICQYCPAKTPWFVPFCCWVYFSCTVIQDIPEKPLWTWKGLSAGKISPLLHMNML